MPDEHEKQQGPALVPFEALVNSQEKSFKEAEELRKQATTDSLTGALNRHGLEIYLETAETPKALLLIDATNFKAINDTYDHVVGDKTIIDTHAVIQSSIRANDVLVRLGGDEFVVILNSDKETSEANQADAGSDQRVNETKTPENLIAGAKGRIAEKMQEFLAGHQEFKALNFDLAVGGIVWDGSVKIEELIRKAEADLQFHKDSQHERGQHRAA
jgi:GGDEF domain-containing protein